MTRLDLNTADAFVDTPGVGKRGVLREAASGETSLRYELFETLEAARPIWQGLEARGVFSPYQRYDWIAALIEARGLDGRLAIVAVHEGNHAVAILPLVVTIRLGLKTARIVGWVIGNGDWVGMDPGFARRLDKPLLDQLLAGVARLTAADLLVLHSQPESWDGVANPFLAMPHQPSPDHFYAAPLSDVRLNAKRIRNIERGRRRLEEALGTVRLVRAATPEAVDTIHAEFLRQRGIRFKEMGVANIFAEDGLRRFFRIATLQGLGSPRPTLAMHALYAGDEIVATSVGSFSGDHYAQYINSTTDGPAAKYSLMGLLMFDLVEELRRDGVTSIDMGLGDFDYKLDWTDQQVSHDAVLPLSPIGSLAAGGLLGLRAAKRAIKQNPTLWRFATSVRSLLNRR